MDITDTDTEAAITSEHTQHYAVRGRDGSWLVSWLPDRDDLDRNHAITAMHLAELVAREELHADHWPPQIDTWAAELGMSGPDAVVRASEPVDPDL